jgi:hypothetical protein
MSIELNWELVQTALQIFGYIGVTTIAVNTVSSWWRGRVEFQRVKHGLILELEENIFAAENCLNATSTHTMPTPQLIDDAWRVALSSNLISRFGLTRVDDALRQLSLIYSRVRFVNQTLTLRHAMALSIIRTTPKYDEFILKIDQTLAEHLEELVAAMKQAKDNLSQKGSKQAFRENTVYHAIVKVEQQRETKK